MSEEIILFKEHVEIPINTRQDMHFNLEHMLRGSQICCSREARLTQLHAPGSTWCEAEYSFLVSAQIQVCSAHERIHTHPDTQSNVDIQNTHLNTTSITSSCFCHGISITKAHQNKIYPHMWIRQASVLSYAICPVPGYSWTPVSPVTSSWTY